MRAKKSLIIFKVIGILMMVVGTVLILHRVMGERLESGGSIQLVTGFSSVAVGAMLLSRSGISVVFYFCFVVAIALVQLPVAGVMSWDMVVVLILSAAGALMVRTLAGRRRRKR